MSDVSAPGWDAISNAVGALYPGLEPRHVAFQPGLAFGSGLQGCSAYRAADHWHYVTFGLTELWAKEAGSDPSTSGWGYELTMRVPGYPQSPPTWPYPLLEEIARYTHREAHPFHEGDRLDLGRSITGGDDTGLVAVAFVPDAELPESDSANGRFRFLQLVGITRDELEEMRLTSTTAVIDRLKLRSALLVTDPSR